MGGERETNVKSTPSAKSGSTEVGSIRIHESGGEVHFHDDKRKLKVAVPVASWYAAVENLSSLGEHGLLFFDAKNGTSLEVHLLVTEAESGKGKPEFDVELTITQIEVADDLAKLLKFTHGS